MKSKPKFAKLADRLVAAGLVLPPLLGLALAGRPAALSLDAYNECDRWAADHGFDEAQAKLFHRVVAGLVASAGYLWALSRPGSERFDLQGRPTGPVSDEHRAHARQQLAERKAKAGVDRVRTKAARPATARNVTSSLPGRSAPDAAQAAESGIPMPSESGAVDIGGSGARPTPARKPWQKPKPPITPQAVRLPAPRVARVRVPALSSLPQPNGSIVSHAFDVVVRRRNSAALIRIWSAKGQQASIDAERQAVLRDVAAELRREEFDFLSAAERLVEGRYADLIVEHRRRP